MKLKKQGPAQNSEEISGINPYEAFPGVLRRFVDSELVKKFCGDNELFSKDRYCVYGARIRLDNANAIEGLKNRQELRSWQEQAKALVKDVHATLTEKSNYYGVGPKFIPTTVLITNIDFCNAQISGYTSGRGHSQGGWVETTFNGLEYTNSNTGRYGYFIEIMACSLNSRLSESAVFAIESAAQIIQQKYEDPDFKMLRR